MRDVLSTRKCGGYLLPRKPLPSHATARWADTFHRPIGGYDPGRPPESVQTLLSHLACGACGLLYEAARAGEWLETLRQEAYAEAKIIEAPQCCDVCASPKLAQEYASGPYGILTQALSVPDPEDRVIGVYCTNCNTVLGILPLDAEALREKQELIDQVARMVSEGGKAKAKPIDLTGESSDVLLSHELTPKSSLY